MGRVVSIKLEWENLLILLIISKRNIYIYTYMYVCMHACMYTS